MVADVVADVHLEQVPVLDELAVDVLVCVAGRGSGQCLSWLVQTFESAPAVESLRMLAE